MYNETSIRTMDRRMECKAGLFQDKWQKEDGQKQSHFSKAAGGHLAPFGQSTHHFFIGFPQSENDGLEHFLEIGGQGVEFPVEEFPVNDTKLCDSPGGRCC